MADEQKPLPMPHEGGSYLRDPATGRLTRIVERERTAETAAPQPEAPKSKAKAKAADVPADMPAAEMGE